ncbi:MAG: hypothetical protein GY834_10645 [Bacteroidetes bacterium]|nr:hypothetical protein [Bacteroidota bacterium]
MYKLIRDMEEFDKVLITNNKPVFVDTETTIEEGKTDGGLYGKIRLVQLYQEHWEKAIIIDCYFIPLGAVLNFLYHYHLIFYNAAYDLHTINLITSLCWYPEKVDDCLYLSRLKYNTYSKFSFYDSLEYAGLADSTIQAIDKKKAQKSDWSGPLTEEQLIYASIDVIYLEPLYNKVKEFIKDTIYRLDIKNLEIAVNYTRNGMPVNQKTVTILKKDYLNRLEIALPQIPIKPRSYVKCSKYLGTSSSDDATLQDLIYKGNKKAWLIKEARHCYKSLEYLNSYDRPIIKGFFQPCAAVTGRFACDGGDSFDHANMQQIPHKLYSVLEAPEGKVFVYKDYSGLELRMAVAYTGEPTMYKMFQEGKDLHAETAKYIFNKQEISDEERAIAKELNFSLIYGAGLKTVMATLRSKAGIYLEFQEVKTLVTKWFDMYPYFREWHNMHKHNFDVYGYMDIQTALGRLIRTYRLTDSLNFPIQGSSTEVTKVSLAMLFTEFPDAYLVNTVHDSNTLLTDEDKAEMWGNRLDKCMLDAWQYVTRDLTISDIIMPPGIKVGKIWDF